MDVYNEHELHESHESAAKGYAAFECNPSIAHQKPFPSLGTREACRPIREIRVIRVRKK